MLYCPSTVKSSTVAVNHLAAAAAAVMSPSDGELKPPTLTSLSSSNGISALSTPLVASLMLHPSASSFQLVSAIPAAAHLTTVPSRAAGAPSLQYIVPPLALSDTGGKIMQMVSAGVQPTVCSLLYFMSCTVKPLKWISLAPAYDYPLMQSVHLSMFYTLHCI